MKSPTEKGSEAYTAGRYGDALEAFRKAAEDNPGRAEAHYNLGGAYYKKGEYDKALKEYEEAVKIDPKMADAYYNMGDALFKMGQYEQALKAFQKADSLNGKDEDTEHNIVVTQKKVKQKEEEQKQQQQSMKTKGGQQDKGQGSQNRSAGNQGSAGQGTASDEPQPGQQMSNEEVQALLDRQAKQEKSLRNYFRPGRKDEKSGREAQIEQILRAAGMPVPAVRQARPGAPRIEKDW